jgi:phage-related protein (TIGR01555 family)
MSVKDASDYPRPEGLTITEKKIDGWMNLIAGLGSQTRDKTENTFYGIAPMFPDQELSEMYMGEGIAKKVIDVVADDATRQWITVSNDEKGRIEEQLNKINAKRAINQALKWTRLYRGAVIVMLTNSSGFTKPISKSEQITGLRVYPASDVNILPGNIVVDPKSNRFDDVIVYPIRKKNGNVMNVHYTRCMVFKGEPAPPSSNSAGFQYDYWGLPVLQSGWARISNFAGVEKGIANLMMEFVVGKYTLNGLNQILASNSKDALEKIMNRLTIINASKSMINSVLLGDGESYDRDTASIVGASDIMEIFMMLISAVYNIPATKLWGKSPDGQNSTGESDMRMYYDNVKSVQENQEHDPLQYLVNRIATSQNMTGDYPIVFNPLWQPTEKEAADTAKIKADTQKSISDMYEQYISTGVLTPEDVQAMQFPDLNKEE